jgi:5,5'-dehydrodivanillate O-demethylase
MDDTHTNHILMGVRPLKEGEPKQEVVPVRHEAVKYDHLGLVDAPGIVWQDEMAWVGQGPTSDRTQEHLVTSDKGVILYHNLILENIEKVQRGEDPMGVVRDAAKNTPYIELKREGSSNKMVRTGEAPATPGNDRFA